MAKSKAAGVPVKQAAKFERKELPEAEDVLGDEFVGLANIQAALMGERRRLDDQIKENAVVLRAMMEDKKDDESWSVRTDGWTASYVRPADRKTLVKELLIQQGVTMKQIEKATKSTPVTPFATIKVVGEEE